MIFRDFIPIVLVLFGLWAAAGLVIRFRHPGLRLVEGTWVKWLVFFGFLCFGVAFRPTIARYFPLFLLSMWAPYLVVSTIYYARPRPGVEKRRRITNFIYHGSFCGALLVTGVILRTPLFHQPKEYRLWRHALEDQTGRTLVFLLGIGLFEFILFILSVVREDQKDAGPGASA